MPRPDVSAPDLAILEGRKHWDYHRLQVANGDGTMIDLTSRFIGGRWKQPGGIGQTTTRIGTVAFRFVRELNEDPTTSLSPLVGASLLNRLDDGTTYSPLLKEGRDFIYSTITVAKGTARPADSAFYEVLRGKIDRISGGGEWEPIYIEASDEGGIFALTWTENTAVYPAGSVLEEVMQDIIDAEFGAGTYTIDVPVPSGYVTTADFEPDDTVWNVLQGLAAKKLWILQFRYNASGDPELSFFEPERDKILPDFEHTLARDVPGLDFDASDVRNVVEVTGFDEDGAPIEPPVKVEDPTSIAEFGDIRRYMRLAEEEGSLLNTRALLEEFGEVALSDTAYPDAVARVQVPFFWIGEVGTDLYEFPAIEKLWDDPQLLAPTSIEHEINNGIEDSWTEMLVRGKPTAGAKVVLGRPGTQAPVSDDLAIYGLSNVRPIPASASDKMRIGFDRGPGVASVWWNTREFDGDPWTDDFFKDATLIAGVQLVPAGQDWVEFNAVAADKIAALRLEPRKADGTIHDHPKIVVNLKLDPVDPKIHGWIDAKYVTGVLQVFAGCNPTASALPIAYEIRVDSQAGSVLASGSFTTLAAAVAGVGGSGALTGLTPPADGKKFYFVKLTDVAGNIEWHSDSVENPVKPKLTRFRHAAGSTDLTSDAYITVESPLGRDVTLNVWSNKASTSEPNPAGAVDAAIAVLFTAGTPGSTEVGPSNASLDNISVFPGRGKKIYLEAVDDLGISSGIQAFTLPSWRSIMRSDGTIIDDAIDRPAAFAASLRPPIVVGSLPADNTNSNVVFLTTDYKLYRWDAGAGAWTRSTDGADIIADSILAGAIAAGAIGTTELAAAAATIGKLNIARVFVSGLTLTNNSPGAGSVAWSACQVQYEGTLHSVAGGNTTNPVIWWDASSPTAFQTSTSNDDLIADGYDQKLGDTVIALNEGGTARQIWNGTLIYGDQIVTNGVKARHIDSYTMEVGKYIQSSNYVAGVSGWKIEDDTIYIVNGEFSGTVTADSVIAAETFTAPVAVFNSVEVEALFLENGTFEVFTGANDSGGSGFRMLRVLNTI